MKYCLYLSCMGEFYTTDRTLTEEELYCGVCGDYDELVGTFRTVNQLRTLLKDNDAWETCIDSIVNTWIELSNQRHN